MDRADPQIAPNITTAIYVGIHRLRSKIHGSCLSRLRPTVLLQPKECNHYHDIVMVISHPILYTNAGTWFGGSVNDATFCYGNTKSTVDYKIINEVST